MPSIYRQGYNTKERGRGFYSLELVHPLVCFFVYLPFFFVSDNFLLSSYIASVVVVYNDIANVCVIRGH